MGVSTISGALMPILEIFFMGEGTINGALLPRSENYSNQRNKWYSFASVGGLSYIYVIIKHFAF